MDAHSHSFTANCASFWLEREPLNLLDITRIFRSLRTALLTIDPLYV